MDRMSLPKIYFIDKSIETCNAFKEEFKELIKEHPRKFKIINDDFVSFMNKHYKEIDVIVSPANSFGSMSGGFDKAIIDFFGYPLEIKIQLYIKNHFYGEQLVNTSFIIDIPPTNEISKSKQFKLIHTPTMRLPSKILDPLVIYEAMRSTLMCALDNYIYENDTILIPAFGGLTGRVKPEIIAYYMKEAYLQIKRFIERK